MKSTSGTSRDVSARLEKQDFKKRPVLVELRPWHPNQIKALVAGKGVGFLAIMIHEMCTVGCKSLSITGSCTSGVSSCTQDIETKGSGGHSWVRTSV